MRLSAQTPAWYDRLAMLQQGYRYPWRSVLPARHGEDAYLELVRQHLRPDTDMLDAACAQGEVSLAVAPQARSLLGYDRTAAWIELARRTARERSITNASFVCHDSSANANGGRPRIPADAESFDVLICSKGPFHWIDDARRVARPGAILLMLVPDAVPLTPWHGLLPEPLRWEDAADPDWARPVVERRLAAGRLSLDSWWSFDAPEIFPEVEQLYAWLTFGATPDEVPSRHDVGSILERVFSKYGGAEGVAVRHRRYIWKSVVPG